MYKPCSSTHRSYFQPFVCVFFCFFVCLFLVAFYLFQWTIQWLISFIIPSLIYLFCLYFLSIFIIICFCYCLFIFCQASFIVACDKRTRACVRACVRVCVCYCGGGYTLYSGVCTRMCTYTLACIHFYCCASAAAMMEDLNFCTGTHQLRHISKSVTSLTGYGNTSRISSVT